MRYALIMAGGAGTRLWPMSRNARPKQLLPLIADPNTPAAKRASPRSPTLPLSPSPPLLSLLDISARRLDGLVPQDRRYICTGESFRSQIRAALPEFTDEHILGEPTGRDTVNAIGLAAAVFHKLDKNAAFMVLTADHLISPEERLRERAELAFRLVEEDPGRLVTFSIKPTHAATIYGYVERGAPIQSVTDAKGKPIPDARKLAYRVARFVEKPDAHRAQAYLESGHFAWNSGMFVFSAATFLDCLKRYKPESHAGLMKIQNAWGTKKHREVLEEVYPTLPRISVDYAVMEPASQDTSGKVSVCTVIADVDWLDVGSWPSYAQTLPPDGAGNRTAGQIQPVLLDCTNTLVCGESSDPKRPHTVALLGCHDLIVVHTPDATLVMPRSHADQLKKLHALVRDDLK